jgi:hypothetical protein
MCAGFRFQPLRFLPSRTIKELSKLSRVHYKRVYFYVPFPDCVKYHYASFAFTDTEAMENRGFEPLTLGLQSRCSSQLS